MIGSPPAPKNTVHAQPALSTFANTDGVAAVVVSS